MKVDLQRFQWRAGQGLADGAGRQRTNRGAVNERRPVVAFQAAERGVAQAEAKTGQWCWKAARSAEATAAHPVARLAGRLDRAIFDVIRPQALLRQDHKAFDPSSAARSSRPSARREIYVAGIPHMQGNRCARQWRGRRLITLCGRLVAGWLEHQTRLGRQAGGRPDRRADTPPAPLRPPSTTSCVPVTLPARSEQRYSTAPAISSGSV